MRSAILRIVINIILLSLISSVVVAIIGLILGWKTLIEFSDGFFWGGAIMIVFGFVSFQGYRQRATSWPPVQVNPAERANLWAADTFRGQNLMITFGVSGSLLIGMSVLVLRLF